nr:ATP-binding protein [Methylosinus sp. Sm6]
MRLRLFLAGALAVTLALALAGLGLVLLFEHHLERTMDDDIETYVRKIVSELTVDASKGRLRVIRSAPDPRFERLHSGFYWQVATEAEGESERSPSLGHRSLEFPAECGSEDDIRYYRMFGPAGKPLRGGLRCVSIGDPAAPLEVRVLAALDLVAVERARDAFATELVATLVLLALGLAFAMWVQVGLGLAPLARLGQEVGEIARGARRRLGHEGPREVQALVDEVNGLLNEREKEIARARNRASDLAHGLKTPLTALAADARLLRARGEIDIAQSLERIGDAMRRHVERELARARIRHARAIEPTSVGEVVDALARTLASAGAEVAFDLRVAPSERVVVERVDLMEVLGNLMENAARHAASRVRVSATGGLFVVEDDGPGLAAESEALIRERGGRLDESGGGGAGLGLAIVQDVLDAYGGAMRFSRSDLGGLRVEAYLARAAADDR